MISDGGELDLDCTAEIDIVGRMSFNENRTVNSFCVNDSVQRGAHGQ